MTEGASIATSSPVGPRHRIAGQSRAHGLLEGDRTASGPGRQWRGAAIFRRAPPKGAHIIYVTTARFASRSKIAAPLPSSAVAAALRFAPGSGPFRPPSE